MKNIGNIGMDHIGLTKSNQSIKRILQTLKSSKPKIGIYAATKTNVNSSEYPSVTLTSNNSSNLPQTTI